MSYILEALDKAEQERRQRSSGGERPPSESHHYPTQRQRRRWPLVRRLALLLPLVAVMAWYWHSGLPVRLEIKVVHQTRQQSPVPTPALAMPETIQANATPAPDASQIPEPPRQNEETPTTDQAPPPPSPTPGHNGEAAPNQITFQPAPILLDDESGILIALDPLPTMDELPENIRQALPEMTFAGHAWSETPQQRLIIVSNEIKKEGETLGPGLHLIEITWTGVVLDYQGTRFRVETTAR